MVDFIGDVDSLVGIVDWSGDGCGGDMDYLRPLPSSHLSHETPRLPKYSPLPLPNYRPEFLVQLPKAIARYKFAPRTYISTQSRGIKLLAICAQCYKVSWGVKKICRRQIFFNNWSEFVWGEALNGRRHLHSSRSSSAPAPLSYILYHIF